MSSRRIVVLALLAFACLSATAEAQNGARISGIVKDATGAVLPGVTVEASSPALMEKTRSVVTDGQGIYSLVDLCPGTYGVAFTSPGFRSVKREGIQLNAGFTATVNVELTVGGVEETITVSGASPVVDVQNVRTQAVLSNETLNTIPNAQNISSFTADASLGLKLSSNNNSDIGGSAGEQGAASVHGNRADDMKITMDGMNTNHSQSAGGGMMHFGQSYKMEAIAEVTLSTNGTMAESETGGVQVKYVPTGVGWGRPTTFMAPRMVKFGAQVNSH
jgi:hypothetical protein